MSERWRDVVDWVGIYKVSDAGHVRSVLRVVTRRDGTTQVFQAKQMTLPVNNKGYPCVRLSDGTRRVMPPVHRLVALAFLGFPPNGKPEVNHIDGNKQNNRLENLEWVSSYGNRKHAWDTGLRNRSHLPIKYGEEKANARLSRAIVAAARTRHAAGESVYRLAREFGVHKKTMSDAISGKAWKLPSPPVTDTAPSKVEG